MVMLGFADLEGCAGFMVLNMMLKFDDFGKDAEF